MEEYSVNLQALSENVGLDSSASASGSGSEVSSSVEQKLPEDKFKLPAMPTQDAVRGIKFDFCDGLRIALPADKGYHVFFSDMETGTVLYSMDVPAGSYITSVKKYFVKFRLEIREDREKEPIFVHDYDATDKTVIVRLPGGGVVGDSIAWFSYVERFQKQTKCKLVCVLGEQITDLFKSQYPDIEFIREEDAINYTPYAVYTVGLFWPCNLDRQPIDFRHIGLHQASGYILGVKDMRDIAPRVDLSAERTIKERYAVIATKASSQAKYWNNPTGWLDVVDYLKKELKLRVLCIDRDKVHGYGGIVWNTIPWGCEDFTGSNPLQERINLIKDAEVFVGLSSGLSWLAWCCKVPVVLISGFTGEINEFYTPYRVINYHVCNSCWQDSAYNFDHSDGLWCPRHKGDEKQFECTRGISSYQVIEAIKRALKDKEEARNEASTN